MGRDRELVGWIARMGAVGIGHVQERFSVCRSVSYAIVARLVEAQLIERVATLPGDPTLLCATRQGIVYAGPRVASGAGDAGRSRPLALLRLRRDLGRAALGAGLGDVRARASLRRARGAEADR